MRWRDWKGVDPAWRLCGVTATNCMIITFMYTLAPFMVLELGVTDDRQALGFWSGFVVSAFFLARTVALPFWGRCADRHGHGGTICASLLLTGCGTALCGFAGSLEAVSAARLLTGACSAVHTSCCALGYELSGHRGSAIVESGFSLGKLAGPGLAGVLLELRPGGWLRSYPFLVPCGVLALMQLAVVAAVPWQRSHRGPEEKMLPSGAPAECGQEDAGRRRQARHAQLLSAGLVVVSVAMEEAFVLYGVGALGISAHAVGVVYLIAGVGDLLLQNTLLLRLIQSADSGGLRRLRRRALLLLAAPLAGMPFAAQPDAPMWARVVLLGLFCGVRTAVSFVFFVSNIALLNEASPGATAAAQSLRMAVGSALQVVGPPLGASAYAWSATSGLSFPLDRHMTFLAAATWVVALGLLA